MDAPTVDYSPVWEDAVVCIAPVELMDTRELALLAVHPDGCVTAWSAQDPSVLLMRKRQINAMCVASAIDVVPHSSLVWFGGVNGVECYRAHRRDGQHVHLQFLYHLSLEGITGIQELQTDGDSLIAMTNSAPPQVILWASIGRISKAENIVDQVEKCIPRYVCGHNTTMFLSPYDEISSFLIHDSTIWLGYSTGVLLILDVKDTKWDAKTSCILRTAGSCAVTVLTLFKYSLQASFVVSGLENGDIILWTVKGAIHIAQYFEHTAAICAITRVPWINGLCTLSSSREIFFWKWQYESDSLVIVERGVLDDDIGERIPHSVCAVRNTEILACGADTSHILHWKRAVKSSAVLNIPETLPSTVVNDTEIFSQQLQELRNECRQWQNLYAASEMERQSAEHTASTSQADAAELRRQIINLEEKVSKWYTESSEDVKWQQEAMEKDFQIEYLSTQLKAAHTERDQMLKSMLELEKERNYIRKIQEKEKEAKKGLISPTRERWLPEEKKKEEEGYGIALKLKSMDQGESRYVKRVPEVDKGVNTSGIENVNDTHIFLRLEKGVQVSSNLLNPYGGKIKAEEEEEDEDDDEKIEKKRKRKNKEKKNDNIKAMNSAIVCSNITNNKSRSHFVHGCIESSTFSEPLLKAFMGEATPQSSASSTSSALPAHYHTEHHKHQNQCMRMDHDIVSKPMVKHSHEGDRNDIAKLLKREELVPFGMTKTLQVQLALMESLLQKHRMASISSNYLPIYSTNILTDVYFMTRDILGTDEASAITQEALEGWPLINEREVVCKLFYTICCRYRTMFFQSSSHLEKHST
ncbi:uncharacterized protein TM35_000015180 [Trypanosoma theileri]|uniref:Uncharacterized protein n=1 Tax=Trypanosoma theileri TaxID=67003 RepID=A0A1X0P9Y2_9TRYP|nr:uncharacterized protein TM35_000015180 [Trypanosoma theileri]ORC93641.1 hypothetical protein TM35_000015180 [Trypanosoma theileri]